MKYVLRSQPNITIRNCPIDKYIPAARIALYGYDHYKQWPNHDCVIKNAGGTWYWVCTKTGNITVTFLGE